MKVDFAPVQAGEKKIGELAESLTRDDLRALTHELMDAVRGHIAPVGDAAVAYIPDDPEAHDEWAVPGEETIGWSLAHLVVHVTASSEEGAAFSSLLARGVSVGGRLRSEVHWRSVTTAEQCLARIEESRRICLAYLETWPNKPYLDTYRDLPPSTEEKFGKLNAPASYLFGLYHQWQHLDQFAWALEVARLASGA